jgi:hypothetical protein
MSVEALSWAWRQHLGGDAVAKHVLICLADWANDHGDGFQVCWHCQASIAARVEVSRETVRRALKRLEERGIIRRRQRFKADGSRASDVITLELNWRAPDSPVPSAPAVPSPRRTTPQSKGTPSPHIEGTSPRSEGTVPSDVGSNPNKPKRNLTSSLRSDVTARADTPVGSQEARQDSSRTKASRLPEDWQLPAEWADWALGEFAVSRSEIADTAAGFRDYWCGKPGAQALKLDWLATWRNWCRKEFRRKRREVSAPQAATVDRERQNWQQRLELWARNGRSRWPGSWGPAPGAPCCLAPPDLLQAAGIETTAKAA